MEKTNRIICKDFEEAYNLYADIFSGRKPGYYPAIGYEYEKFIVYYKWEK